VRRIHRARPGAVIRKSEETSTMTDCANREKNLARCTCTYMACGNRAACCECLHSHLAKHQLPGCCFPANVEKTYDRSFEAFIKAWS
jgi:hypothetical protein